MHQIDRTRIATLREQEPQDSAIDVYGWVRTKRDGKAMCFFEVNDGSCLAGLQISVDKGSVDLQSTIDTIQTGASIRATGQLVASPGAGQSVELACTGLELIGSAPAESYPLQKKRHSFEYLREIAHLRGRTNTFGAVMRVRNRLSWAVHQFFQDRDFLYLQTPIITASDAEGAGALFQVSVPGHDQEFFGKPAFLTVSGQLNAEAYATALDRVYTFGPTFRAENSNTTRHLAEFWMVEPEIAFCDLEGNMALAQEFVQYLLRAVLDDCREDLAFFDKRIQPGLIKALEPVAETDFKRLTYSEAIDALERAVADGQVFSYPVSWGMDLQTEHERYLVEDVARAPVIVTDYPKDIKAFYMKQNTDGKTVRAMDVLVPGLGEIIGGSQREDSLSALRGRLSELGLDETAYEWYLDLRRFGTVPHAGFGLGFERLVRYVTGMQNIRDVIAFPRAVGNADF